MSIAVDTPHIHIIGAGFAGSEAAWALAEAGVPVTLHEMRPVKMTEAHQTDGFAELVCSNSFRSDDWAGNAVGLLHAEMRRLNSLVMRAAAEAQVPAGGALAVDRDAFSALVTQTLSRHPRISISRAEIADPTALLTSPQARVLIATGPLTSAPLTEWIGAHTGEDSLAFFDAIAPIVYADSINYAVAWKQSRYDKQGPAGDSAAYVNCPMDKAQYEAFVAALLAAPKTEFKDWEKNTPYFEGCLPIEVMAERGPETLRFGPMKPVGLSDPRTGARPYAVVQLRQDNKLGSLFNMVGFQTKMRHGAQTDVFRMIPGLENATFARLGGIHRNTFLNSPRVLDEALRLKAEPRIRFAGQITGVEGYVESAATGMLAGRFIAAEALGHKIAPPPATTAFGALLHHVTGGHLSGEKASFQPMNVNFGLFPPIDIPTHDGDGKRLKGEDRSRAKKRAMAERALRDLESWIGETAQAGGAS